MFNKEHYLPDLVRDDYEAVIIDGHSRSVGMRMEFGSRRINTNIPSPTIQFSGQFEDDNHVINSMYRSIFLIFTHNVRTCRSSTIHL